MVVMALSGPDSQHCFEKSPSADSEGNEAHFSQVATSVV